MMMRILVLIIVLGASLGLQGNYATSLLIVIGLQALPAIGLALLTGYTGQISLGHAAFYGLGAYAAALLSRHAGIPVWIDIVAAGVLVALVAWAIGWLVFRLQGHYLAMATLAFGIIVHVGLVEMHGLTGGPNGLTGIAPLSLFGKALTSDFSVCIAVWSVCIVVIVLSENLIRSPIGLAMRAISESERVAGSVGNDVQAIKRMVMMLSGLFAALAGALYAHYIGYLSPGPFDVGFSVRLLLMVAVGGFANVWGVLFGVAFVTLVGEGLKTLGAYDVIAYGVLLVVSVIFFPRGLLHALGQLFTRRKAIVREVAST
jgi:branched-chain amino acid transport system permease protein